MIGRIILGLAVVSLLVSQALAGPKPDDVQPLRAIFMDVSGKVRWRPNEKAPWKNAAVDDLLDPGAEVRTGLKSRAALRVGKNATVLVDSGTTFQIPEVVQDGQTLRTLATVKTGHVDFKVDEVGFANDFKVVTPQTTLSVRGTGFGVDTGALHGVQVTGVPTNKVNAIEIQYVMNNLAYFMSGASTTSTEQKDPVQNAWVSTIGPPPVVGTIVDGAQLVQTVAQGQSGNAPTSTQWVQQQAAAQTYAEAVTLPTSPLQYLAGLPPVAGLAADSNDAAKAGELARRAAIQQVLAGRDSLHDQWGGESGANATLYARQIDAETDAIGMGQRRDHIDQFLSEDGYRVPEIVQELDAMGATDDKWNAPTTGLLAQARQISQSIATLATSVASANADAIAKQSQFNTLLVKADTDQTAWTDQSALLSNLRAAIVTYKSDVQRVVASGQVTLDVVKQLERSVQLLDEGVATVDQAEKRAEEARTALAQARTKDPSLTLEQAQAATDESAGYAVDAAELEAAIVAQAKEIERIRFAAFYAVAAAAVSSIPTAVDDVLGPADLAQQSAVTSRTEADLLAGTDQSPSGQVQQVVALADALDTYWLGTGQVDSIAPAVRMESILAQSETDRDAMFTMLEQLKGYIAQDDIESSQIKLSAMTVIGERWNEQGSRMRDTREIDDQVQARAAAVESAFETAQATHDRFNSALQTAATQRDLAQDAAARLKFINDRLQQYKTEYTALAAGGRGGSDAAQRVQQIASDLAAVQETYQQGIQASAAAASAVNAAQTYGQRVYFAAASNARLRAANLAAETALKRATIESRAFHIQDALGEGEAAYADRFGAQHGGGGT